MANPVVNITSPTAAATYQTAAATINLGGTATADGGEVPSISWINQSTSQAGIGFAGLPDFTANNIPLQVGENIIVVTATDPLMQAGTDTITVTRTAVEATQRPAPLAIAAMAARKRRRRR